MQVALLLDAHRPVQSWELKALELAVAAGMKVTTILYSTNDPPQPHRVNNAAYYALGLLGRRARSMKHRSDLTALLPKDVRVIGFEAEWEDESQRLPSSVTDQLDHVDVVVRLGMNKVQNPESIPSTYGVISYQYGAVENPGGQPPGFYELDRGESVMGVIVQQRTHSREADRILVQAYSRVVPTSYKTTLTQAMALGVPLLAQALTALQTSDARETVSSCRERRYSKNRPVFRALAKMTAARLGRLFYGAFKEKRWNVAYIPGTFDPENTEAPHFEDLQPIELPEGYTFAADPCAYHDGRLYVELMHAGTGKGEIFVYTDGTWRHIDVPVNGGHLSYPQIVEHKGATYLFPEVADVGSPAFFEINEGDLTCGPAQRLVGLENERVVDGTLVEHDGHWYLFGSPPESPNERLDLWVADNPLGPWSLHPGAPVLLDPRSGRMGGPILHAHGCLYRVGQDGSVGYGQGVTINRIEKLTPDNYKEVWLRNFNIEGAFGPHTILASGNGNGNGYWVDYYTEKTTPMAGVRRLRALLK